MLKGKTFTLLKLPQCLPLALLLEGQIDPLQAVIRPFSLKGEVSFRVGSLRTQLGSVGRVVSATAAAGVRWVKASPDMVYCLVIES